VTWLVYQQIIAAYADGDRQRGKALLTRVIDTLRAAVPAGLEELATLGRTLHRRRDDVLAYFADRASNGPTEAINGRLEALRRNALGFRNLTLLCVVKRSGSWCWSGCGGVGGRCSA
jgi:transposase